MTNEQKPNLLSLYTHGELSVIREEAIMVLDEVYLSPRQLLNQRDELAKALSFYADNSNYSECYGEKIMTSFGVGVMPRLGKAVLEDTGEVARAALAKVFREHYRITETQDDK